MMNTNTVETALKEAVKRAGSQLRLAEQSGVSQGNINGFLNGKNKVENMTIGTFFRLFPEIEVNFFRDQRQTSSTSTSPHTSSDSVEQRLYDFIGKLSPDEKIDCLMFLSAKFRDKLINPGE